MNHIIVDKTYTVELLIPASSTTQQVYFPILQVLDRKLTQGMDTYNVADIPKSPSNVALASAGLLAVSFLNLVVGDVQQIWNLPLKQLVPLANNAAANSYSPYAYEFQNLPIIWAKSYVFIADTTQIAGTPAVFLFNIKYTDYKK